MPNQNRKAAKALLKIIFNVNSDRGIFPMSSHTQKANKEKTQNQTILKNMIYLSWRVIIVS
jgi:hypothetical protein